MRYRARRALLETITELVQGMMQLPACSKVDWLLKGAQSWWVLKYTGQGKWHTDVAPNRALTERTWALSVALKSERSHFELINGCEKKPNSKIFKVEDRVVIFPTNLLHRGFVCRNGSRTVFAAEFSLDRESQELDMSRK
jgi:hypothetical protein